MDEKKYGSLPLQTELIQTKCAICENSGDDTVLYPATLSNKELDGVLFSARRMPDQIHCQIVRCKKCGLVRSNPYLGKERLSALYEKSQFTYDEELSNLQKTYGQFLKKLESYGVRKERLLEIGCGNGYFLEEALRQGVKDIVGIEPSSEAKAKGSLQVRERIIEKSFFPGLFPPESFNVICLFQVLDHLTDPNIILQECYKILQLQGYVICINHDERSWLAKVLGERCPIYDVQHPYLYNKMTQKKIFEKNKFKVLEVTNVTNIYSLGYWLHLMPLPSKFKQFLRRLLNVLAISKLTLKFPVGNLGLIAQKVG